VTCRTVRIVISFNAAKTSRFFPTPQTRKVGGIAAQLSLDREDLGWVPSAVRAKPATSRGIPGAARSSLDVFALTSEMPDILKGGRLDCIQKGHIHRVWLISSDLCLCPLIVLSPSIRQLIVNKLCNCVVLRNNPPKWWITLLKKLRSAANYDRLLRFLDICAKIRQNITD
jgi:hypothetical protein